MRTMFDLCRPRDDILTGDVGKADFAADLAQVVRRAGPEQYRLPDRFFAQTYPTRNLKNLLAHVCSRLSGRGTEVSATFRLGTSFGGGKTHALIALVHAAGGMPGVANVEEFIDPSVLPQGRVRVAAFDGENADPANGRAMGEGVLAFTPWGELAYALAGRSGYERVRRSDERAMAPGADTLRELFGGMPTLILLDELSVYLRKVKNLPDARDQLTAFLSSLLKAVEAAPDAALVYTLAIGKDGRATDAYSEESQFIADQMAELESASARKATLLNPTEDDETPQVLRRRLFERIDDAGAAEVIEAYHALWQAHREALPPAAVRPDTVEGFRASYPLHPEVLATLTGKTATLTNFQRVRGMLRLLAAAVARLWQVRPADATALHLHHLDPGFEPIYEEITVRLGQSAYAPAGTADARRPRPRDPTAGIPPAGHRGPATGTARVRVLCARHARTGQSDDRRRLLRAAR
jgi:predicted AAA+ superfamily ATPase